MQVATNPSLSAVAIMHWTPSTNTGSRTRCPWITAEMARPPQTALVLTVLLKCSVVQWLNLEANEQSIVRKRSTATELRDGKREDGGGAWRERRRRTEHNCYGEDPQLLPIKAKLVRQQSIPLSRLQPRVTVNEANQRNDFASQLCICSLSALQTHRPTSAEFCRCQTCKYLHSYILQKITIWSGRIFFVGCYLGIFTSCLYCIIAFHFHRFNVYVENFQSYVPLHLYVCWYLVCVCQT